MNATLDNQSYLSFVKQNLGKRIVIIYGNCHTTALRKSLEQYKPFTDKFAIYPIKAIQEVKDPEYFRQKFFTTCDLFIHQSIRMNNRYGKEYASESIIKQLKPSCEIISIPNVYHLPICFFPQYSEQPEWKINNNTIFFRDSILDSVYSDHGNIINAMSRYQQPDYYRSDVMDNMFSSFIEKVKERENDWDVKCSDFIMNNYRDHRLFYDPNHPTPFFISYLCRQLLLYLGYTVDFQELNNITPYRLDDYEMPICDSVYEHFKMTFKRYNIRHTRIGYYNNLDLKQYIRRYWMFEWQNKELELSLQKKSKFRYDIHKSCYFPVRVINHFKKIKGGVLC